VIAILGLKHQKSFGYSPLLKSSISGYRNLEATTPSDSLSQVVSQKAIIRLLVEKGIFTKEEFLKMADAVNLEIGKWDNKPRK
jgi:hypothetical protein